MTPQEIERLFGPASTTQAPSATPQPQAPQPAAPPSGTSELVPNPDAPGSVVEVAPAAPPAPALEAAGRDIAQGLTTDLPRAVASGVRNAVQETASFVHGASEWQERIFDPIMGRAPTREGLKLPKIDAPESTTGKLVSSVSQFITGMIGLGKLSKPLEAAGGLAQAGRAAKVATEAGKAATVGAIAFDPEGGRLSDIIESIPGLSNPFTAFLKSDPKDSRTLGRFKNALESIGMDAALVGALTAGTRAFKSVQGWRNGTVTLEEMQKAVDDAERSINKEIAPNAAQPEAAPSAVPEAQPVANPAADAAGGPGAGPRVAARSEPALGAPQAEAGASPEGVALSDTGTPRSEAIAAEAPAGAAAQGTPADVPPPTRIAEVSDQQVADLVANTRKDMDAFQSAGGWDGAIASGHVFGRGERLQWQKMVDQPGQGSAADPNVTLNPLEAFMARVADSIEADINKARGGNEKGVLTDKLLNAQVRQRMRLWGEDPDAFMSLVQGAGKAARSAVANFEAALVVGQRAVQDAYGMASRITAGDLSAWGGNAEAAHAELRDVLRVVATVNGHTEALKASFGRGLRRSRAEFAIKQSDVDRLMSLDGNQLARTMAETGGDPQLVKRLANPTIWQRLQDASQWLLVNNLLWGWKTHFVNAVTNSYMVGARPMERVLGSYFVGGSEGALMRQEAWKQYTFMKAAMVDGFQSAIKAWQMGDSIMTPHQAEAWRQGINPAQFSFKSPDSIANLVHNAASLGVKAVGVPTRALGVMDEMTKQIVYRSKVMARAHVEGINLGLSSDDLSQHVRQALFDAFDSAGRAVDVAALQEARIASFQQDLLPKTIGAGAQHLAANVPAIKIILPFIKTPTNVMRYGWKMTPGLNMLQSEYRQMLSGRMGVEAQAQAIGQMSLGALFLGVGSLLAYEGMITGGGPSDPRLKKSLTDSGWQPYSIAVPGKDGKKTYISFGKYDPIVMPLGMVADIVDAWRASDEDESTLSRFGEAATGALMSITKQIGQKSYLMSLNQTIDAIMDPDRSMGKWLGGTMSNFIPMSSALRNYNLMDPYMRDTRGVVDKMMATVPGLSEKVPPKRDMWGDPLLVNRGLWVTSERDLVDAEVNRMVTEGDVSMGPPSPNFNGVDLREVTMVNGKNAYDHYQELAGRPTKGATPLKDAVAKIMKSAAYKRAPDGEATMRGTKLWILAGTIHKYREVAGRLLRADANVRKALMEKNRAVAEAYAASKKPETPQQSAEKGIANIGSAFGVDLEALMK